MDMSNPTGALYDSVNSTLTGGLRTDILTVMMSVVGVLAILIGFYKLQEILSLISSGSSGSPGASGDGYAEYAKKRTNAREFARRYEIDEINRINRIQRGLGFKARTSPMDDHSPSGSGGGPRVVENIYNQIEE